MAESLAHRWGQIIGDVFETFVRRVLADVAQRHGLYLDYKRPRAARTSAKVTWQDGYGNKHDLDYMLERGGTDGTLGVPVAFVESAWRRYTKHSKNKAQEIEAAIMPVALTFSRHQPFCGAVLAGEFTRNARQQLESKGFAVLHISMRPSSTALLNSRLTPHRKTEPAARAKRNSARKSAAGKSWNNLRRPRRCSGISIIFTRTTSPSLWKSWMPRCIAAWCPCGSQSCAATPSSVTTFRARFRILSTKKTHPRCVRTASSVKHSRFKFGSTPQRASTRPLPNEPKPSVSCARSHDFSPSSPSRGLGHAVGTRGMERDGLEPVRGRVNPATPPRAD